MPELDPGLNQLMMRIHRVGLVPRSHAEQVAEHQANQRREDVAKQARLGRKAEMRAQKSARRGRGRR